MAYPYITEDNLVHRQNYMYSAYGGKEFLADWEASRTGFLASAEPAGVSRLRKKVRETPSSRTAARLETLLGRLQTPDMSEQQKREVFREADGFLKAFEVRKRLYEDYAPDSFRPVPDAGFYDLSCYLLLSEILLLCYQKKKSLRYLNAMLKVDDTLLSLSDRLDSGEKSVLAMLLEAELSCCRKLDPMQEGWYR